MASSAYDVNYYMGSDATIVPTTPLLTQMVNLTQSTITATTDTTSSDQVKRKVMRFLTEETSLVWIIFGTIGNLLTLLVLCKPRMRKHSTFTYLTILSLCDTFVLYFGLFRDYLVYKYKYDIDGDFICKFHVFFFYFVLHMASWLLVAVNIDRLIAATFLGFSKKWCTPRVAILVSLSLALFFFLINSHFIFFVNSMSGSRSLAKSNQYLILHENISYLLMSQDISKDLMESIKTQEILLSMIQEKTREQESVNPFVYSKCLIKTNWPGYNFFFTNIFTWIDAGAQVILPFIIMVICNVNIIFKVLINKSKSNGKNQKRLRKIKGMCVMIVSVSIIFFVLEMPVLIFLCLMQGKFEPNVTIDLLWTIVNLMMYTNHVINFFSYCMTGTQFRRELLNLILIDFKCLKCFPSLIARFPCLFYLSNQKNQGSQALRFRAQFNRSRKDFPRRGVFIKNRTDDSVFFNQNQIQQERQFMLGDISSKPNDILEARTIILNDDPDISSRQKPSRSKSEEEVPKRRRSITIFKMSRKTKKNGDLCNKKVLLTSLFMEKRLVLEDIDKIDGEEGSSGKAHTLTYTKSLNENAINRRRSNSLGGLRHQSCRRLLFR